mmetsp:Transcript_10494/g.32611  ORF Transcript_10494/g.32611 Transcript_10494/m.32611 type:complete len:480 (-) Transcript_10494:296-1735(-)
MSGDEILDFQAHGSLEVISSDSDLVSLHHGGLQVEEVRQAAALPSTASRPSSGDRRQRTLLLGTVCALLGTACSCTVCAYFLSAIRQLRRDAGCPVGGAGATSKRRHWDTPEYDIPPRISEPEMFDQVKEQTIWAYWTHKKDCPSSKQCVLPPAIQLCTETVRKNRGSFDYRIIHKDEVLKYVTMMELPARFMIMLPAQQKDALMNAVLARYGGVALDISTVLLRPLDEYWDEMVEQGATFSGYMYRISGMHWSNAEVMAVWFLMTRREGVFSSAVRSQVIGMGDHRHPQKAHMGGYHNPYFAMGDQTLTPIMRMFSYDYPSCLSDPTVRPPKSWNGMCPELECPQWSEDMPGPARNDSKLLLREPQEGPQLPFAFTDNYSMPLWHVHSDKPVFLENRPECDTMRECWEKVFLPRYHGRSGPGEPRLLNSVKLFNSGGRLKDMSRKEILADHETYFYHWLRLAGLDLGRKGDHRPHEGD